MGRHEPILGGFTAASLPLRPMTQTYWAERPTFLLFNVCRPRVQAGVLRKNAGTNGNLRVYQYYLDARLSLLVVATIAHEYDGALPHQFVD